jgi:diadenylate cyclase
VNAAVKLSKNRIGALIAIERDVGLGEYVENGQRLDAALSSELLETIFYPGNALHDGAVIIQHDRAAAAACLFPLSEDPTLSRTMGTRHRAAIGISEETDAIAIVVSEETGRISVCAHGKITSDLTRESLEKSLRELYTRSDRPTLALRWHRGGPESPAASPPSSSSESAPPPPETAEETETRKRKKGESGDGSAESKKTKPRIEPGPDKEKKTA